MRDFILVCCLLIGVYATLPPLQQGFRPPSVPLILFDPYMSVWSNADSLSDTFTTHWSGSIMNVDGIILIDNKPFLFMGQDTFSSGPKVPPMTQTDVKVYPTQTICTFSQNGVMLTVTFSTPSIPTNLTLWSTPVTYITYSVVSVDGNSHNVSVLYENTAEMAVNDVTEEVQWSRGAVSIPGVTVMRVGTTAQNYFGVKGDGVRINWGYYYVAVRDSSATSKKHLGAAAIETTMTDWQSVGLSFSSGKPLPPDSTRNPRKCNDLWPVLAVAMHFGAVSSVPLTEHVMVAYDDIKSMRYFGDDLPGLWRTNNPNDQPRTMLSTMYNAYDEMMAKLTSFDVFLVEQLTAVGGIKYATIASLAYRQVTGSCKVVYNAAKGIPWVFMKEISSDGDVSTVDVIFPASPLFFYLSPDVVDLLLRPILSYSLNETNIQYNLAWAPHHLGYWPVCDITPQNQEQMPVEETGNMLMMLAKVATHKQSVDFLDGTWSLLEIWGQFLTTNLPDPPKQLCTDDFEGPSAHNVNLAAKGIVGLACYAKLLRLKGDTARSAYYLNLVSQYTQFWLQKADAGDHYLREYDIPGSWSLKYNFAFDRYLDLGVFPKEAYVKESQYYVTKLNTYGTPLDERKNFTLLEYMGAVQAVLTTEDQSQMYFDAVYKWANESPDRVPLSDWYDTVTGRVIGFRARATVGNLFTKMLLEPTRQKNVISP